MYYHTKEYDVVVLGSGTAGKLLAWTLASRGRLTAVVERRYVGGSCPRAPHSRIAYAARDWNHPAISLRVT
jgi:flavin-dependent dehydrogenase